MVSRRFGPRTQARSQALQLMFQAEATERSVASVLAGPYVLALDDEATIAEPLDEFAERLALGADDMREGLDAVSSTFSRNWSRTRMPSVDRNLLRLAIYEMLEVEEVAHAVTIDESVELAKAFGTDESSRFVNGLLGRVSDRIVEGADIVADALATQRALEEERAAAEAAAAEAAAAEEAARAASEAEGTDEPVRSEATGETPEPTDEAVAEAAAEDDQATDEAAVTDDQADGEALGEASAITGEPAADVDAADGHTEAAGDLESGETQDGDA